MIEGKIIKVIAGFFSVRINEQTIIKCKPRGILRYKDQAIKPIVGDNVVIKGEDGNYYIDSVKPRSNGFIRPKIANIDIMVVVQSCVEPKFNSYVVNKSLAFYEAHNVDDVIIVITKYDLLSIEQQEIMDAAIESYQLDGYKVFNINDNLGYEMFKKYIKNKVICLAGNSGVGKSTLLNRIDPELRIRTQSISKALNRGKHTTTNVELIYSQDYILVDTPGFGTLELTLTPHELSYSFHDFRQLAPKCKYNDCQHVSEDKCAIIKAVDEKLISATRYQDYLKMLNELKNGKKY